MTEIGTQIIDLEGATIENLTIAVRRAHEQMRPMTYPIPGQTINGVVVSSRYALMGWAITNTDGAVAANFAFFDGTDANGIPIINRPLPAATTVVQWFGPQGLLLQAGLFQVSGLTVVGSVFLTALD